MESTDFDFTLEELDGVRVVHLVMPEVIAPAMLASASATYLAMWDDERPTVGLGDVSRLRELTPEIQHVFAIFARRVAVQRNYVGSAWFTGENHAIGRSLRALAYEAGRDPMSIVETEAEAIAYLRTRIAAYRTDESA